jgi:hypothetical protein
LKHRVALIPIDRQVAFAVEYDVIVDDDLRIRGDRRLTVAVKRMWTAAFGNGIKDALFSARKYGAVAASASTIASSTATSTIACSFTAPNQGHQPERADTQKSE